MVGCESLGGRAGQKLRAAALQGGVHPGNGLSVVELICELG